MSRPLRIFTWHVHSSYLYALSHTRHEIYIPVKPGLPAGYTGRGRNFPWHANVREVPVEEIRRRKSPISSRVTDSFSTRFATPVWAGPCVKR